MSRLLQRLRSFLGPKKKKKRDPFLGLVDLFSERAAAWPSEAKGGGARIGVLLTPWISTAVPFFSLECVEMIRRAGPTPVIVFDPTDLIQNATEPSHVAALEALLKKRFANVEIYRANGMAPKAKSTDEHLAESLFRENAIWRSRGEDHSENFMAENKQSRDRIVAHIGKVRTLLNAAKVDRLLIPGGIFGLSGVHVAIAREMGLSFATYDGSTGVLRLTQQGIAAHLADMPNAFAQLQRTMSSDERAEAIRIGRQELEDRAHARDFRQFQVSAATGRDDLRYDLLIPLNIRWDSAALGRQRAFATVAEWLDTVLRWVHQRGNISVCIRQHPRERLAFAKGSDDIRPLLRQHEHLGERLRFVAADEPVNSYDLMRHTHVVLPHTSTVGIEAALLGLPVILGTSVYYEDFGFCRKAENRDDYFALIEKALSGNLTPSQAQQDDAAFAYYLTQRCAFLQTSFNAHPDDFRKWVQIPHEDLWAQPEVADFRTAFIDGKPLSVVRHQRHSHAG